MDKKTNIINLKVTAEERTAFHAVANARGVGLSKLIRAYLARLVKQDAAKRDT
jgi:antitoxin component of RelBE/YafQ-DinJ toxin-antitoxin module